MGLKKYPEAEISFKIALGEDPETQKQVHAEDFYKEGSGSTQISRNTAAHEVLVVKRTPEIEGICLSSLGEIYIRTKRVPLAKEAFDRAAKADPTKAPLFLRNEATFFFQIGDAADQVEAANKAIEVDPAKAILYYFKAQGLAGQAIIDPKTQKLTLPPGCAEAYQKYLQLDPTGQFAPEAKSVLTAANLPTAAH
jgi:tetratricopeptide (TPR) repeat protein